MDPQPSLSRASFKPRKPPNLPNLVGLGGGSNELGVHNDGVMELHAHAITATLQVFFFPSSSFSSPPYSSFLPYSSFFVVTNVVVQKQITITPTLSNKNMMTTPKTRVTTGGGGG